VTDRVRSFFQEPTPRRLLLLTLFVAGLVFFRHLLVLLVFFVVFERLLALGGHLLSWKTRLPHKVSVGIVAVLLLALSAAGSYLGVRRAVQYAKQAGKTVPDKIEEFKSSSFYEDWGDRLPDMDAITERVQNYAGGILKMASTVGHVLVWALIGFILAIVFVVEEEELKEFRRAIDPRSIRGTLLRWLGYVAEAMLVTVQFQCVVAAVNAVLTFPILLIVGIPHAPALAILIFASGLVPVVGNFVMGVVLSILAYQVKGWFGFGLFVVLTFVLHKLEAYFLNPRLAARHVRVPTFVLIVSLVLWEHAIGLAGLFVSFPFLYVTQRIRDEFMREDQAVHGERSAEVVPAG
jgi:predicted PurR-regulated permease PerM